MSKKKPAKKIAPKKKSPTKASEGELSEDDLDSVSGGIIAVVENPTTTSRTTLEPAPISAPNLNNLANKLNL